MPDTINAEALWEEARDLGDEMVEAGADPNRTAMAVAHFLDAIIPLDILVPGLPGAVLEMADGPALESVVGWLVERFKADPEKKAERQAARMKKRARRKQRKN